MLQSHSFSSRVIAFPYIERPSFTQRSMRQRPTRKSEGLCAKLRKTPMRASDRLRTSDRLRAIRQERLRSTHSPHNTLTSATPSPAPAQYQYEPLKEGCIRLLELEPGSWDDEIQCTIQTVSLDENTPRYTAISYAWGHVGETEAIRLNNGTARISATLFDALNVFRCGRDGTPLRLWVDAMCINQSDVTERNHQVRLMTDVYSRAEVVYVWLGVAGPNSSKAFQFMKHLHSVSHDASSLESYLGSEYAIDAFQRMGSLLKRGYWGRLWVMQEVYNAKQVHVYCGEDNLPWSIFRDAIGHSQRFCNSNSGLLRERLGHSWLEEFKRCIVNFQTLCRPEITNQEPVLLDVLCLGREKLCTDPRDKIYGLLGILPPHVANGLSPDYASSPNDIYINAAKYVLETTKSLDIICETIPHRKSKLPSFVPDWSDFQPGPSFRRRDKYSASASTRAFFNIGYNEQAKASVEPWQAPDQLTIAAIPLGIIKSLGSIRENIVRLSESSLLRLTTAALKASYLNSCGSKAEADMLWERNKSTVEQVVREMKKGATESSQDEGMHTLHHHRSSTHTTDSVLQKSVRLDIQGRRHCLFSSTGKGGETLLGLGPRHMDPEDVVVVPLGCSTPVLLRETAEEEESDTVKYEIVGDAYVDGYMYGKAIEEFTMGLKGLESFVLV